VIHGDVEHDARFDDAAARQSAAMYPAHFRGNLGARLAHRQVKPGSWGWSTPHIPATSIAAGWSFLVVTRA